MKVVIGLFRCDDNVQGAVDALKTSGFAEDKIKICSCKNELCKLLDKYGQGHLVGRYTWFGALLGLVLFGSLGFFAGFIGCRLLGYSPSLFCAVIVTPTLIGVLFGAILGYMFGKDQWAGELDLYHRAVRAGKQVILVQAADDNTAIKAKEILQLEKAEGIEILENLSRKSLDLLAPAGNQVANPSAHS